MRLSDWINRQRHNRGFGIQSPSAFFFITQVLKERLPYYAYPTLDKLTGSSHNHFRELFRITNYHKPANCISVGSAAAACAMILAKPSARHFAITPAELSDGIRALLNDKKCHITETAELFPAIIDKAGDIGMLYVDAYATDGADRFIRTALPHTNNNSVIVVDGINRSKTIREWWQQLISNNATVVTYDMFSYGLLFFDKEKRKQHYTLKR